MPYIKNIKGKDIKVGSGSWKIKPNQYDDLFKLRDSGISYKEIAKKFNVRTESVSKIFKKFGLVGKANRKYSIKHDWLNNLDCKEKFYFLGFMWADGTVERNLRISRIELAEEDKYILEKFGSMIYNGQYKLYPDFHDFFKYENRQRKWSLKFYSKEFCTKLNEYGCVPNKSLIVDFPNIFKSDDDFWHFVRGLFDGDGCASCDDITIVGSNTLCEKLQILLRQYDINVGISKNGNVSILHANSLKNIKKLFFYLYKDSENLRLERKYSRVKQYAQKEYKIFPVHVLDNNLKQHVFSFLSIKDASNYFNKSISYIYKILKNKTIINNYILFKHYETTPA